MMHAVYTSLPFSHLFCFFPSFIFFSPFLFLFLFHLFLFLTLFPSPSFTHCVYTTLYTMIPVVSNSLSHSLSPSLSLSLTLCFPLPLSHTAYTTLYTMIPVVSNSLSLTLSLSPSLSHSLGTEASENQHLDSSLYLAPLVPVHTGVRSRFVHSDSDVVLQTVCQQPASDVR